MSLHHKHPTFMPYTKTCHHNLQFSCTSQCSAANMHIIHPSNNNTFHLHISASAEARLIYPAPSHYNQPIRGTCGPQGSSLCICCARLCSTSCWLLYPEPIWEYRLEEVNLISFSTSTQSSKFRMQLCVVQELSLNVLVWPKIYKKQFENHWNSRILAVWDVTLSLGEWVELFEDYCPHPQESGGPYSSSASWPLSSKHHHRLHHHIPAHRNPHLHYSKKPHTNYWNLSKQNHSEAHRYHFM